MRKLAHGGWHPHSSRATGPGPSPCFPVCSRAPRPHHDPQDNGRGMANIRIIRVLHHTSNTNPVPCKLPARRGPCAPTRPVFPARVTRVGPKVGAPAIHSTRTSQDRPAAHPELSDNCWLGLRWVFLWRELSGASSHPQQWDVISMAAQAYWSDSRS